MAKTFEARIELAGKVSKSLTNAFNSLDKQNNKLEKAYSAIQSVGVKAFKAIGVAAASVATAVFASAEATREYRQDLAKMYNNANQAGIKTAEAWSGLEEIYAISGEFDSANEAMSNLIATGYKGKDLEKVIQAVNGATIKWQDTIKAESLADSIQESLASGTLTGQFAEVIARTGYSEDVFKEKLEACSSAAERQQFVLNWLSKSGLAEVNAAYQETNKSLIDANKADLKYQNSMAKLGEVAEPIAALFKGQLAQWIGIFAEKLAGVDFNTVSNAMQKVGELGSKAFDLIWNALSKIDWETLTNAGVTVLTVFTDIFNFVVNNWSSISPIIYGIVAAMVAYKAILLITKGVKMAAAIAEGVHLAAMDLATGGTKKQAAATLLSTLAQNGLNLAFLACPITWIVIGIAAIVAIIVALAKKVGGFKELWNICWNGIKTAFDFVANGIKAGIQGIGNFIQGIIDKVQALVDKIKAAGEAVKNSKLGKAVSGAASWVGDKLGIGNNALGGTYSSPLITWVAEGGDTETIVPHNNRPRSKALALEAVRGTGLNIGGGTYVFSPTIYAGGGNTGDLNGILDDAMMRFKAMLEEYEQEKARVSY